MKVPYTGWARASERRNLIMAIRKTSKTHYINSFYKRSGRLTQAKRDFEKQLRDQALETARLEKIRFEYITAYQNPGIFNSGVDIHGCDYPLADYRDKLMWKIEYEVDMQKANYARVIYEGVYQTYEDPKQPFQLARQLEKRKKTKPEIVEKQMIPLTKERKDRIQRRFDNALASSRKQNEREIRRKYKKKYTFGPVKARVEAEGRPPWEYPAPLYAEEKRFSISNRDKRRQKIDMVEKKRNIELARLEQCEKALEQKIKNLRQRQQFMKDDEYLTNKLMKTLTTESGQKDPDQIWYDSSWERLRGWELENPQLEADRKSVV